MTLAGPGRDRESHRLTRPAAAMTPRSGRAATERSEGLRLRTSASESGCGQERDDPASARPGARRRAAGRRAAGRAVMVVPSVRGPGPSAGAQPEAAAAARCRTRLRLGSWACHNPCQWPSTFLIIYAIESKPF